MTPLIRATAYNNITNVKTLLKKGANPLVKSSVSDSLTHVVLYYIVDDVD